MLFPVAIDTLQNQFLLNNNMAMVQEENNTFNIIGTSDVSESY